MTSIYLASSWRNNHHKDALRLLRTAGHDVYDFKCPDASFHWSQIDEKWETWTTDQYQAALDHPLAVAGFEADFSAMNNSKCCVLLLPCGRSAHLEAGFFIGENAPVFVYSPEACEPELMYKMTEGVFSDLYEILEAIDLYPW